MVNIKTLTLNYYICEFRMKDPRSDVSNFLDRCNGAMLLPVEMGDNHIAGLIILMSLKLQQEKLLSLSFFLQRKVCCCKNLLGQENKEKVSGQVDQVRCGNRKKREAGVRHHENLQARQTADGQRWLHCSKIRSHLHGPVGIIYGPASRS